MQLDRIPVPPACGPGAVERKEAQAESHSSSGITRVGRMAAQAGVAAQSSMTLGLLVGSASGPSGSTKPAGAVTGAESYMSR